MLTEKWSIEYNELVKFLFECGFTESNNVFELDGIEIRVIEKKNRMIGSLEFPEILIEFSGDNDKVTKFHDSFKFHFFRAGG